MRDGSRDAGAYGGTVAVDTGLETAEPRGDRGIVGRGRADQGRVASEGDEAHRLVAPRREEVHDDRLRGVEPGRREIGCGHARRDIEDDDSLAAPADIQHALGNDGGTRRRYRRRREAEPQRKASKRAGELAQERRLRKGREQPIVDSIGERERERAAPRAKESAQKYQGGYEGEEYQGERPVKDEQGEPPRSPRQSIELRLPPP